jgi:hypothetical protein
MHFGSFLLNDFVFIFGGTRPSALKYSPIDDTDLISEPLSLLFAFDTRTTRWIKMEPPRDTRREMDGPLEIARTDVIRAENRLEMERSKGFMLGG